jgi:hypothetical protein
MVTKKEGRLRLRELTDEYTLMSAMTQKALRECGELIVKEESLFGGKCICDKIANKEWQEKFKKIVDIKGISGVLFSDKDVTDIKI